jgi:DNA-binding NtrC family response regulator
LVVDDDESIRKTLSTILEGEGYTVDTAQNGEEAIDKSNSVVYNVALIDIHLPDVDGIQLLPRIKQTEPKMRKVLITGFPTIQKVVEAANMEADGFLLKPFDMDKVLETIKRQLKEQEEETRYNQDKVTEFIATRAKELVTRSQ